MSPTTWSPGCCSCSTCARSSARPAPSSVATPATAAPAPCTSTAAAVKSCNVLAVQADGADSTTIEGLASDDGTLHPVQEAFRECHGLQCGFCTPGMIMQAVDLLKENPNPTEEEIRLGPRGQPVPLHRLPEHREVGAVRRAARRTPHGRGERMTATEDAPAAPPRSASDRRRKEDQRLITGRTRWTDNITAARHAAHGDRAQPVRPRADHERRHLDAADRAINIYDVFDRRGIADDPGRADQRLADHRGPEGADAPADGDRPGHLRRRTVAVVVARSAAEARDAAEPVDIDYEELPAVLDIKEALTDEVLAHPDLGTNKCAFWQLRLRCGRHRRQRRRGDREGARRRHRDRARVPSSSG